MIRRLDIKIVLILMVTVLVPLGVSVYLVVRAIDTSLGLGLNRELAGQLAAALDIRRQHIRQLKLNMEHCFAHLTDSHMLLTAAENGNDEDLRSTLREIIEKVDALYSIRLADESGNVVEASIEPGQYQETRTFTLRDHFDVGRFETIEAVFLADASTAEKYKQAGEMYSTYEALVEAPPNYLKNRFILV
jgi:hypothetical protein